MEIDFSNIIWKLDVNPFSGLTFVNQLKMMNKKELQRTRTPIDCFIRVWDKSHSGFAMKLCSL